MAREALRPYHGGDLGWAIKAYPGAPRPWIDLSTGINPWSYPVRELPAEAWSRLPDQALLGRLGAVAAGYYRAPDPAMAVAAPGSQALIQWLPRLRPPGRVRVLGPTYGEHAPSWQAAGHRVEMVGRFELLEDDCEVAVVVNPNNPDGRAIPPERLELLARRLASQGGWLVVDEAFGDLVPELSLAPRCDQPGCVVLRSFGKFFGLAGLRLGFALAAPGLAASIRTAFGPWAVAAPGAHIAIQAFGDAAWIAGMRQRLSREAAALDALLGRAGLEIIGGTDLYRLAGHAGVAALFERLLRQGVFVRHFPERPDRLRFGIPDEAGRKRLEAALLTPLW